MNGISNPLISVIVPTYGGPELLPRAINSVLRQTYANFEIIIVDDNGIGTPNQIKTKDVIQPFLIDSRIKYIPHEINKNGSAARNTGFKNSKGTYIALLDDDDEYLPNFLNSQVEQISKQNKECGLVYCSYENYMNGSLTKIVHASLSGTLLYETLIHSFEIPTSAWLLRRSVYEDINGFDESFRRHQDWEFLSRLAARYIIVANDEICYRRHQVFRNSAQNVEKSKEYRNHYLSKMMPLIKQLPIRQQEEVVIYNKMDIAFIYIKQRKIKEFYREWREIRPGFYGIRFLIQRFFKHL